MPSWQRQGVRRKGLVGGKQVAEPWIGALGGVVSGERKQKQPVLWKEASVGKSDHLAHKDRQGSRNVLRRLSGQ